jgi:uncharacterized protein YjiK
MMNRAILATAFLALAACTPPSAASRSMFAAEPNRQWALPEALREVSGLAVSPDGRLFGHNDEIGVIYEIDFDAGHVVKSFALGSEAMTGDFEGLTITPDGDFWLTDSRGRLLRFREGAAEARVDVEAFDSGAGELCEIEGIAYQASEQSLLLACKRMLGRGARRDPPLIVAWAIGASETREWGRVNTATLAAAGVRSFQPSGLEFDQRSGRLIVISANDGAIAEFGPDGAMVAVRALSRRHRQTEGVAILSDGSLILADEGGNGQPMISRYPRNP